LKSMTHAGAFARAHRRCELVAYMSYFSRARFSQCAAAVQLDTEVTKSESDVGPGFISAEGPAPLAERRTRRGLCRWLGSATQI
jgi:hypothetical protein